MNKNLIPSDFGALKIFMDSEKEKKIMLILKYLLLAVLMYFPLFGHLDTLPIRLWDESRLAINAYEMYKDGDLIVTHFEGKPDMWNTKPPLLIWCQAGLMHVIGVNELSIRLPSAIAAFLTCVLLFAFAMRYFNNYWYGFIAVLVLITTDGYIDLHCTRTGDYDAMMIFFSMLYCFSYHEFLNTKRTSYLYVFFIAASMAVLTKSITGVLFLPGLFLYTLYRRQLREVLKNRNFYVGIFIYILLVGGYYLLRESRNPGYIAEVWQNELGGRFLEVTENHSQNYWYYMKAFLTLQYSCWCMFTFIGVVIGLFYSEKKFFDITVFLLILSTSFFLIITISKTKLLWYDTPIFPLLALLSAIGLYFIFLLLKNIAQIHSEKRMTLIPFLLLLSVFFHPYWNIVIKTFKPKEVNQYMAVEGFYDMSYYLKDVIKGKSDPGKCFLVVEGYAPHITFYYNIILDKHFPIIRRNFPELLPNDVALVSQDKVKVFIENNFEYQVPMEENKVKIYKLLGRKKVL